MKKEEELLSPTSLLTFRGAKKNGIKERLILDRSKLKIVLIILFLIFFSALIYFTFFYTKTCKELSCFQTALFHCKKAKFINDAEDVAWFYRIKTKTKTECIVEVQALQVKKGVKDTSKLEGKKMECYIPLKAVIMPHENLSYCHGLLKEEMQNLIIEKLHAYIIENIGKISEELKKIT